MRFGKSKFWNYSSCPLPVTDNSSVIALSKIFALNDSRVVQTVVKGDLIIQNSDRIKTRSQARQSKSYSYLYSVQS
jgi:hypothetical protein